MTSSLEQVGEIFFAELHAAKGNQNKLTELYDKYADKYNEILREWENTQDYLV